MNEPDSTATMGQPVSEKGKTTVSTLNQGAKEISRAKQPSTRQLMQTNRSNCLPGNAIAEGVEATTQDCKTKTRKRECYMYGNHMTVCEAAHRWVNEMNAIPTGMIRKMIDIEPEDWHEVTLPCEGSKVRICDLPMWGTMWSFGDSADDSWLDEDDGIAAMSRCGFRIYKSEEFGYYFGIDGAGYDFYECHWCPLYNARGLCWHDPVAEKQYQMEKRGYVQRQLGNKLFWFDGDRCVCEVEQCSRR